MINLVIDGALFSESIFLDTNKNGMIRIAEEVTGKLMLHSGYDISFMNTMYSRKYDSALKNYIHSRYPDSLKKIISRTPVFSSAIPGLNRLSTNLAKALSLTVSYHAAGKKSLYHSFYYPFTKRITADSNLKKSITFLDIIPLRVNGYDDALITRTKDVVNSIVPNYAISISEFSKQDLLNYQTDIKEEQVFVAPLAASNELFYQNKDAGQWSIVRKKYGLPEKYFLCISSTDKRKNLHHLINCFNQFVLQEKPKDLYLVMTGNTMYSYKILDTLHISKEVREKIIITKQYIEDQDLSVVYSNAMAFFFMSLYEGFGLPVLEAMQCGVPVITSNVSAMPEVTGDAAFLTDPHDQDALCSNMTKLYNDDKIRKHYSALGIERAKLFSWKKCAEHYDRIFNIIAAT